MKKDDASRELILARRQFFIASALAGVALTGCDDRPSVCLDMPVPEPTTSEPTASAVPSATTTPAPCLDVPPPEPSVCLEMAMPEPSAQPSPAPAPRVCLKRAAPPPPSPPPQPRVCLERRPPDPGDEG